MDLHRMPLLRPTAVHAAALTALALGVVGCSSSNGSATGSSTQAKVSARGPLPGTGRPLVTIGDKNFTEQFVLGELYRQALSAQGYSVTLNRDIGPTEVTLRALDSGRVSMYPEYLSTWNATVAGYKQGFRTEKSAFLAARSYAQAHALELLRPTPFSDTDGIAVTVSYASEHGLRTIGDLRKVAPNLTLGAPPQFQQDPGGLPGLEQVYGLIPASFKPLAIGGQYQALDQGTVQAADVNTTDGQLLSGNYTLLQDPDHAFGWGQVVPVVPDKVFLSEGPAFARTINKVSSLLTQGAIRELNAAVDVYHQDPTLVAKEFLQAAGLVALTSN